MLVSTIDIATVHTEDFYNPFTGDRIMPDSKRLIIRYKGTGKPIEITIAEKNEASYIEMFEDAMKKNQTCIILQD